MTIPCALCLHCGCSVCDQVLAFFTRVVCDQVLETELTELQQHVVVLEASLADAMLRLHDQRCGSASMPQLRSPTMPQGAAAQGVVQGAAQRAVQIGVQVSPAGTGEGDSQGSKCNGSCPDEGPNTGSAKQAAQSVTDTEMEPLKSDVGMSRKAGKSGAGMGGSGAGGGGGGAGGGGGDKKQRSASSGSETQTTRGVEVERRSNASVEAEQVTCDSMDGRVWPCLAMLGHTWSCLVQLPTAAIPIAIPAALRLTRSQGAALPSLSSLIPP